MSELWGPPTWELIHNLCDKVEENNFNKKITILWNVILLIINNLPCPHCRNHASKQLSKVNVKTIYTKQMLVELMFRFHNYVNVKLKKEKKQLHILNEYVDKDLKNSVKKFLISWNIIYKKLTLREYETKMLISNTTKRLTKILSNNKVLFKDFE